MKTARFLIAIIAFTVGWMLATQAQCPNIDFSYGNLSNWQCFHGNSTAVQNQNTPVFPVMPMPDNHVVLSLSQLMSSNELYDELCPLLKKVPDGFMYSLKLGNYNPATQDADAVEYTLYVDSNTNLLLIYFAEVLQDFGHPYEIQPYFSMDILDSAGNELVNLPCHHNNFTAGYADVLTILCEDVPTLHACCGPYNIYDWTVIAYNLTSMIGNTVKIRFFDRNCTIGPDISYAYIVCKCQPMQIELTFCEGQSAARMSAPEGFATYTWSRSSDPNWHLYTRQISVPNPWDAEIFTCVMTSKLSPSCGATIQTEIKRTTIDASFFYAKPGQTDDPMLINKYDTCSRVASFVDLSRVFNSDKEYVEWHIHGLPNEIGESSDSIFTVHFPDPDTPTTYLVRLQVMAKNSCSDTSDALSTNYIRIYPSPRAEVEGTVQLCAGNIDTLRGHAKRTTITRFQWHFDPSTGATIVNDSVLQIIQPGTYILEAENEFGCIVFDTHIVTPLKPIMNVTMTHVSCYGGRDGRFVQSAITGGAFPYQQANWTLPNFAYDGTDSLSLPAASGIVINRLPAGKYYFYGIDANSCEIRDTIEILQPDSLKPRMIADSATCGNPNGRIRFYAIGGTAPYSFITTSLDTFFTGNAINNLDTGIYYTKIIDNNYYTAQPPSSTQPPDINTKGCVAESWDTIFAIPKPYIVVNSVAFERCELANGNIKISVENPAYPLTFRWEPTEDSTATRLLSNLKSGIYTIYVTDSNDCQIDTSIEVGYYPPISLTAKVTPETCNRTDGQIIIFAKSGMPESLEFGWGDSIDIHLIPFDSINSHLKGNSTYFVRVKDTFCLLDTSFYVPYIAGPDADFITSSYSIPTSTSFALTETSKGSIMQGDWDFGDGNTGQTDGKTRMIYYNYPTKGEYVIFLLVTDTNGCTDTVSKIIHTYEEMVVYIPNSFTPNGDGLNDTWKPIMTEYSQNNYTLTVFDRWGSAIFQTHDPQQAWDGTVNGKFVQSGTTYTYRIEVQDMKNDLHEYVGIITVIR
ncbi:MAG: gliding motility-associated C-terminal domain-containing protein [Bacteroidales bacterium]|jgi:gliding motility-associated-like protein|nr:gliding motility-associated C-terminal domain-containing protein [Bacteroidales bacterium]